ncbi:flagellar motor switch protein FliN [Dysosmobacter sp.]|jgi:flagellar motor switch protein FliN/FliY|uniref:flagellar motor switch protein FliN n=1 Tax=Dysosmobacter sp. TaxID=2591382 RepID=UPI003D931E5E
MSQTVFNSMELDAIGELMNISLGSSATAVSNMLDHRVDITTPKVQVVSVEDFSIGDLEPAIGIEIKYVSGLEGSNIMLLKRSDVKTIVDILMGSETSDEEFELNELTISAVCEVMNQMMGAASTALSDFLGYPVNISTPQSFALDDFEQFKKEHFPAASGNLVVVRFILGIEDMLKSEFVNVMSVDLARELLAGFEMNFGAPEDTAAPKQTDSQPVPQPAAAPAPAPAPAAAPAAPAQESGTVLSQEEIERLLAANSAPAQSAPAAAPAAPAQDGGTTLSQAEIERLLAANSAPAPQPVPGTPASQPAPQPVYVPVPQPVYAPDPKVISAKPVQLPTLDVEERLGKEQADNLEMIMSVPLEISVEIGRTRRKVEDILALSKGSLVVLDKLAGDQVDLFVNGLCVARGDVVVIDDNFGVRITEVLKHAELLNQT